MAVAAAFLSLLLGKQLPDTMAVFASMDMFGILTSQEVNEESLKALKDDGITTLLCSA